MWLLPLVAYGVWVLVVFVGQRWLLFPGRSFPAPPAGADPPGRVTWSLATSGGNVEAWYYPVLTATSDTDPQAQPGAPGPALLFAHGNGEMIDDWGADLRLLTERGMSVLLVEYPGYGRSAGAPSQRSITEAMASAFDRLAEQPEVDAQRVVALGRSVGGGAAAALSAERPLAALILQSTFTSVRSFAGRYLVPSFLVRDPFDNVAAVRAFQGPVLVFHGRRDDIIPFHHGQRLATEARDGTLVPLECAHNDCPPDWVAYLDSIEAFLLEHRVIRDPAAPSG